MPFWLTGSKSEAAEKSLTERFLFLPEEPFATTPDKEAQGFEPYREHR
jgi:hypothetical protein